MKTFLSHAWLTLTVLLVATTAHASGLHFDGNTFGKVQGTYTSPSQTTVTFEIDRRGKDVVRVKRGTRVIYRQATEARHACTASKRDCRLVDSMFRALARELPKLHAQVTTSSKPILLAHR